MYKMFVSFFVPLLIVLCKAFGDWMDVFICKDSSLPWVVTANLEQALYIARMFLTLYIALYLFTLNFICWSLSIMQFNTISFKCCQLE